MWWIPGAIHPDPHKLSPRKKRWDLSLISCQPPKGDGPGMDVGQKHPAEIVKFVEHFFLKWRYWVHVVSCLVSPEVVSGRCAVGKCV